jgi:CHASE1-domain containing sensor protein/two-component sensor histidine kinase
MVALASLAMATYAFLAGEEAARFKFEASADDALNRVESRVDLQIAMLRAARGMFTAAGSGEVTREEFKAFFDALGVEENLDGLRGMGFLGVAHGGDLASIENKIREYHGIERRIFPQSEQDLKTPILLYEPLDSTTKADIGFDMYTDPLRRAAIQAAIDTGQPRASEHLMLGERTGGEIDPGFLVFYTLDLPAPPGEATSGPATAGILYEAIRTADLLESAFGQFPALPVHAEIYGADPAPDKLLYQSANTASEAFGDDFLVTRKLIVAGQPWTLLLRPTADFSRPTQRGVPIMLGVFGLLLAGAMAIAARYQMRAFDAVSLLHEATEKSLGDKDLMLQEMKHRIKNSITRVLAIARQTASGSKDITEFSASFAARLQAMAASQDMLTRSRWQKADLAELLRIELTQVFGNELPDDMLSGPKVLLSETETQALGLTFHELATNALKYGEAGNSVDALKVTWTLPREGQETLLALRWEEMARQQLEPPAKTGFGTKLIDMNIRHELGGSIRRDYRDDRLVIEIDIPLSARRQARA